MGGNKLISISEAGTLVPTGGFIGIGGIMLKSKPMALLRSVAAAGCRDLTVMPAAPSTIDVDYLIGQGCTSRVIIQAVSPGVAAAVGPNLRQAAANGTVEIVDLDQGMINAGLRAAAYGVPSLPTVVGIGSDHVACAPDWLKLAKDPFTGEVVIAVRALAPDIALVHAEASDPQGRAIFPAGRLNEPLLCAAARQIIVSAERIVDTEEIERRSARVFTWAHKVLAVVDAPRGCWPLAFDGHYTEDPDAIKRYIRDNVIAEEQEVS
jgi:glutaconate CoA-transferase, subunit A